MSLQPSHTEQIGNRKSKIENPLSPLDLGARLQASCRIVDATVKELLTHADPYVRLAAIDRSNRHLALTDRILDKAIKLDALLHFQNAVVETLAGANLTVRRRILEQFENQTAD